jgi:hypothetical protein
MGLRETFVFVGAGQNNRTDRSLQGPQSECFLVSRQIGSIEFLPIWLVSTLLPKWPNQPSPNLCKIEGRCRPQTLESPPDKVAYGDANC